MSKLFDDTIADVKKLSDDEQEAAALALMDYLEQRNEHQITDEQLAEIDRRIANPDRAFVSYEDAWRLLGLKD
jgi:putative addiction module component (TIGR02574 family)